MSALVDEYFWAGYLKFLVELGEVTLDTPPEKVAAIKAEFMAGLQGDDSGSAAATTSIAQSTDDVTNGAPE